MAPLSRHGRDGVGWVLSGVAVLLCCLCDTASAAGVKLWEIGSRVEENPNTVFVMFAFVVSLTIVVELGKHKMEHATIDPYRLASYEALYVELMLVGVVSFFLILSAELGLTDVRIGDCDTTPAPATDPLPPAAADLAASGSGSKACGYGFDLDIFEYAHLVLFFMGITYCIYMQVCFTWRDRLANKMRVLQVYTLSSWKVLEVSTSMGKASFARKLLVIRSAMCIEYGKRMEYLCDPQDTENERLLAKLEEQDEPPAMPTPAQAVRRFNMAKYFKLMYSELTMDLLHIPVWVWVSVLAMASINLVHMLDVNLAITLLVSAVFGPACSVLLWWRLEAKLTAIVSLMEDHPDVYKHEYALAKAHPDIDENATFEPTATYSEWLSEGEAPWTQVLGDGSLFSPTQKMYTFYIQLVTFSTCFYVGQLGMLTPILFSTLGVGPLLLAWLLPLLPLGYMLPLAMQSYVLVFLTYRPTLTNLRKVLSAGNPHKPPHAHGHGHGHDSHGHGHEKDGHGGHGGHGKGEGGGGEKHGKKETSNTSSSEEMGEMISMLGEDQTVHDSVDSRRGGGGYDLAHAVYSPAGSPRHAPGGRPSRPPSRFPGYITSEPDDDYRTPLRVAQHSPASELDTQSLASGRGRSRPFVRVMG